MSWWNILIWNKQDMEFVGRRLQSLKKQISLCYDTNNNSNWKMKGFRKTYFIQQQPMRTCWRLLITVTAGWNHTNKQRGDEKSSKQSCQVVNNCQLWNAETNNQSNNTVTALNLYLFCKKKKHFSKKAVNTL